MGGAKHANSTHLWLFDASAGQDVVESGRPRQASPRIAWKALEGFSSKRRGLFREDVCTSSSRAASREGRRRRLRGSVSTLVLRGFEGLKVWSAGLFDDGLVEEMIFLVVFDFSVVRFSNIDDRMFNVVFLWRFIFGCAL